MTLHSSNFWMPLHEVLLTQLTSLPGVGMTTRVSHNMHLHRVTGQLSWIRMEIILTGIALAIPADETPQQELVRILPCPRMKMSGSNWGICHMIC